MIISLNRKEVFDVESLRRRYNNKHIIVAIDSSKTNTAIGVMSRSYQILDTFEFNGKSDKDVLNLIAEQRSTLRIIFEGAKVLRGGIEDIITKKEESDSSKINGGLYHHHSRYVITAVFVSFICFFQDNFNLTLELVNNQAWKKTILPEHLNRRGVYKGSVEYVREKYPMYITGNKDDDVCDVICIGEYLKVTAGLDASQTLVDIPDEEEFTINPCKYRIYPSNVSVSKEKGVQFKFNELLNIELNARAMANRLKQGQLGYMIVPISYLTIEEIYSLCVINKTEFTEKASDVMLIVTLK